MIILDTETSGLLNPHANDLSDQPSIIEIYALKVDEDFNFVDEIDTLIHPGFMIAEHITKITGITNKMLNKTDTYFPDVYDDLCDLFLGETQVVAHNCRFDMDMIFVELARMEKQFNFPWPKEWICTVEKTQWLHHKRLSLSDLHFLATGKNHSDKAHRAKEDVYALARCIPWIKEKGLM